MELVHCQSAASYLDHVGSFLVAPAPTQERGRGYASALTAAATRDQLDSGCRFCLLLADLADPTSNRIYQAIGYEPVADVDQYRFTG